MSDIHGDKWSEQQARVVLPILVRQAQAGQTVTYSELAEEIGIHRRTLAYPLATIIAALNEVAERWAESIPLLTGVVVTKNEGLPSTGFGEALANYEHMPPWKQTLVANQAIEECYAYPKWPAVLAALGLEPAAPSATPHELQSAAAGHGIGEGEAHQRLKEYVRTHPRVVDLRASTPHGQSEHILPTADAIDVLFTTAEEWLAVEVKAANAAITDIRRGLFQCVKYRALVDAVLAAEGLPLSGRSVLVLENTLPQSLVPLRNTLGVEVIENIRPE